MQKFTLKVFLFIVIVFSSIAVSAQTALQYDGSTKWVSVPTMNCPNSFTFEAWINWQSNQSGFVTILEFGNDRPYFGLSGGQLILYSSSTSTVVSSPSILPLNEWVFVACSYDATTNDAKLYINDNLVDSGNAVLLTDGLGSGIGFNVGDTIFEGRIADLRIWDNARSDQEVLDDFSTCPSGSEAGLYAYYDFEDGAGSIDLTDKTSNGYNGILVNFDIDNDWVPAAICDNLSVETIESLSNQLKVIYNSDRKQLEFFSTNNDIDLIEVGIYNIAGQLVRSEVLNLAITNSMSFSQSDGLYMLRVNSRGKMFSKKIIIH